MGDRIGIFAGPSLIPVPPLTPGVRLLPPARRGDVVAVAEAFSVVALIDGELVQSLAVTPREIRQARQRGARLLGAASLGALRACECPEEMEGVGTIYTAFREGTLVGDDEVACLYEPGSYALVSYPLVNVRHTCALAVTREWLAPAEAEALIGALKQQSFDRRTASVIVACLGQGPRTTRFLELLRSQEGDLKRQDALVLLEHLDAVSPGPITLPPLA